MLHPIHWRTFPQRCSTRLPMEFCPSPPRFQIWPESSVSTDVSINRVICVNFLVECERNNSPVMILLWARSNDRLRPADQTELCPAHRMTPIYSAQGPTSSLYWYAI